MTHITTCEYCDTTFKLDCTDPDEPEVQFCPFCGEDVESDEEITEDDDDEWYEDLDFDSDCDLDDDDE